MKAAHPEYYAIWDGERMDGEGFKQDLCSEGLFNQAVKFYRTVFDVYGDPRVNIGPADGFRQASESSPECESQETPERGSDGLLSDHVWEFANNVAWELYESHPDKEVGIGSYAYYKLPPQNLSRPIAPNVVVTIARWRSWFEDPARKEFYRNLTERWIDVLPSGKVYVHDYYLHNREGRVGSYESFPVVFPHLISEDLAYLEGKSGGDFIEVLQNCQSWDLSWDSYAANALNVYVTTRLYWDADRDVDALLQEYYDRYYGPVSAEMEAFYEYAEEHWPEAPHDPEVLVTLRGMAEEAQAEAGEDTVYGKRIDLLLGLMNSSYVGEEVVIDSCGTLDSPSTTYRLSSDVSSDGTCFHVIADGVTIDCQGHTITYGVGSVSGSHGVHVDEETHFNITGCDIGQGGSPAGQPVYVKGFRKGVLEGNTISSSSTGVYALGGSRLEARGNTISSSGGVALYLSTVTDSVVEDNELVSGSGQGLYLFKSSGSNVSGNIVASDTGAGAQFTGGGYLVTGNRFLSNTTRGAFLYQAPNNTFVDNHAESRDATGLSVYSGSYDNLVVGQSASGGKLGVEIHEQSYGNVFRDCGTIVGGVDDASGDTEFVNCTW